MISRSTLIGALVVVELAIVGLAARAVGAGAGPPSYPAPARNVAWSGGSSALLDRTIPTGPSPVVVVDVHDVDVTIETAAAPSVRAYDTTQRWGFVSGGSLPAVTLERTADGVRVSAPENAGTVHLVFGGWGRRLHLTVPPTAQVRVVSGGSIDASGLRAPFVAHVADDSISVRDQRGDVDVSTNDGRIELDDVQGGRIEASTNDGRLVLTQIVANQLDASTDDGRIQAHDIRAVDGTVSTKNGRVTMGFADGSDAVVTLHTADGKITVDGIARSDSDGDHAQTVQLGSGRGHFAVSTGDGSITVTQGATV
jgi:hypothetical protein